MIPFRVANGARNGKQKINDKEAKSIVALLSACIEHPEYQGETFGVISLLGEEQADLIQKYISEHISPAIVEERRILCGTAAQFQGDERNVIFLSMVDSNDKDGPLRFLGHGVGESTMQRYNVAVSRAKDQLWIVHSLDYKNDLQTDDIRRGLLEYADNPDATINASLRIAQEAESPFEISVGQALVAMGYDIVPQWKVGAYRIDMVARYGEKKVAIECDGDRYHSGEEAVRRDMERQTILERVGWQFIRIRGSEYYRDPDKTIQRVVTELNKMGIDKQVSKEEIADSTERDKLKATIIKRAAQIMAEWEQNLNKATSDMFASDIEEPRSNSISDVSSENMANIYHDKTKARVVQQTEMSKKHDAISEEKSKQEKHKIEAKPKSKADSKIKASDSILEWRHATKSTPDPKNDSQQDAIDTRAARDDVALDGINGKNNFIAMLKQKRIDFIDNSQTSNIIWVLYRKDAQAIVEEVSISQGFICKLYKRGSEATGNKPAWMILLR